MNNRIRLNAREITLIAIFIALTAVLSQIAIPIPLSPVPISFGLVAVYMTGLLLRPKHAVFAQLCYLLLGAVGAPVFSNFRGGAGALFGPTGGYLIVYPLIAWIVSMAVNGRHNDHGPMPVRALIAMFIAHCVLYLGGTLWLSRLTGNTFAASLSLAVIPYIPLDIVKILFCAFAIVPFRTRLTKMRLLQLD